MRPRLDSVRQEVDADADQHGGGPAAMIHVFFQKDLSRDGVGHQRERGRCRRNQAQVEVIQRKEQREEGKSKKAYAGKEKRAGQDRANCALQPRPGANVIQVTERLHGSGGEHFAGSRAENDGRDHCGR